MSAMPRMMFAPVNHIEIRDGQARIAGRNTKVKMIISRLFHGTGASIDEVMEQYGLTQSEVYAVLTYYYDHKAEIDQFFEQEDRYLQSLDLPTLDDLKTQVAAREQSETNDK